MSNPVEMPPDSLLRCPACNVEVEARFADCILGDWPRHCDGLAMQLVSTKADTLAVMMTARDVVWSIASGNSIKEFTR